MVRYELDTFDAIGIDDIEDGARVFRMRVQGCCGAVSPV